VQDAQTAPMPIPMPMPVQAPREGWVAMPDAAVIVDAASDAPSSAAAVPDPPRPDAGARRVEAGSAAKPDGAVDQVARARSLFEKGQEALDEGEFARAFELAEESLRLRRTARTYLLRAQAQQRLDHIEEALASVDAAAQLAPASGTVWEVRGRILWAARRRDDARAAFEKFLELEPNSPKAASVRRLMNEPR
jgi:tetratricopeptide (TPR) repeat protein